MKKIIVIARGESKIKDTLEAIIHRIGIEHLMYGTQDSRNVIDEVGKNPHEPYILITGTVLYGTMEAEDMISKVLEVNPNGTVIVVSSMNPNSKSKHHHLIATNTPADWGGDKLITILKEILDPTS